MEIGGRVEPWVDPENEVHYGAIWVASESNHISNCLPNGNADPRIDLTAKIGEVERQGNGVHFLMAWS